MAMSVVLAGSGRIRQLDSPSGQFSPSGCSGCRFGFGLDGRDAGYGRVCRCAERSAPRVRGVRDAASRGPARAKRRARRGEAGAGRRRCWSSRSSQRRMSVCWGRWAWSRRSSWRSLHFTSCAAPMLDSLNTLPGPQRDALKAVFGLRRGPRRIDSRFVLRS